MRTKFGNATINNGYYIITSQKEGNHGKYLHRLIAEDYFGEWINDPEEPFDIHHIDGNRLNNCVLNLEPIPHDEHLRIHNSGENNPNYGKTLSNETKRKISESNKGKTRSDEHRINMSKTHNTTGYYRVHKQKCKNCKQGFTWIYYYYEDNKHKSISSIDIDNLETKVKAKGLTWRKIL